ncbi:Uncharacterised protein r2_g2299 [Pycnogonum litorale]
MLSSYHTGEMKPAKVARDGSQIFKPDCVIDYNKNMGGVDRSDQMLATSSLMRRYVKSYKKIAFYCFDMMFLNSYIIFKKLGFGTNRMTFRQYCCEVGEQLVSTGKGHMVKIRKPGRPSFTGTSTPARLIDVGVHFLQEVPLTPSNRKGKRRCRFCKLVSKKRVETRFQCEVCDVGLCFHCCKPYHTTATL